MLLLHLAELFGETWTSLFDPARRESFLAFVRRERPALAVWDVLHRYHDAGRPGAGWRGGIRLHDLTAPTRGVYDCYGLRADLRDAKVWAAKQAAKAKGTATTSSPREETHAEKMARWEREAAPLAERQRWAREMAVLSKNAFKLPAPAAVPAPAPPRPPSPLEEAAAKGPQRAPWEPQGSEVAK